MIYLITGGTTTPSTTPNSPEFSAVLNLVEAAAASAIPLIQLREKHLSARVLYELGVCASAITHGTKTRLLVNDRFDIALAARADGVQLTSQSLPADVVRAACGGEFLIGVSTHSLDQALLARDQGADFVVFGPVFHTESKLEFGAPQGVGRLRELTTELGGFPVIAIGGVSLENVTECFAAGAAGVAAITLLSDAGKLAETVEAIQTAHKRCEAF